jgi:cation:H+ antiporter
MEFLLVLYSLVVLTGLLFLWWGGGLTVRYVVEMSAAFKLTTLFIGFVLVALLTSLPELSMMFSALFRNLPGMFLGTILGSNVCDIAFVLGLSVILGRNLIIKPEENRVPIVMLGITCFSMILVFALGVLFHLSGFLLITIYIGTITWLWRKRTKKELVDGEKAKKKVVIPNRKPGPKTFWNSKVGVLLKLFISLVFVLLSSEITVHFAVKITKIFQLSFATIGATLFAIGTSLPELTLSLNAARKREYSLVLGNILGSVFAQGTFILGLFALISPHMVDIRPLVSLAPFMFLSFAIVAFGI